MGFPKELVEASGGCIQFTECDLLAEILHELTQFMVSEVAKLCLEDNMEFPHLGGDYQWVNGIPLPL